MRACEYDFSRRCGPKFVVMGPSDIATNLFIILLLYWRLLHRERRDEVEPSDRCWIDEPIIDIVLMLRKEIQGARRLEEIVW